MKSRLLVVCLFIIVVLFTPSLGALNKIYAAWFCGQDSCTWQVAPNVTLYSWLGDRGDGNPTFNVVNFAFVNPVALLQKTTDSINLNGIPRGFTQEVVNYFQSKGITVTFSIGGASYSQLWDQALNQNPAALAQNAAAVATQFNVGIEIDYEQDSSTYLNNLETFIKTYRAIIPYENSNTPSAKSILTIDLGAGTGYLTSLSKASWTWLNQTLLNWAYAMVAGGPYDSITDATTYWEQHLNGVTWVPIPPLPANQLVVSLYASSGSKNCQSYSGTVLEGAVSWVNQQHSRGIAFWAAGCPSAPSNCATNCTGIISGSKTFLG